MSVKVQKYLANLGKSVAYTTADVLSEKFTYVKDFKNENQEVFKEAYHSIKDYRTTFARIKKTITDNKVMDAARVGFDSIVYSVTTGDFYAKNKEQEVMNKYGGNLMQGMDIDDDDFDFGNEDVTDGDKVIATAVKKNSKLQTAITTEAIVKTGKAQMDVSKENTMLLYTQNERLINKLDGGLQNITGFLKQNAEQTAKVQNQMNENLNKFMANVDNNVAKLTKQMDELLEMQRNLYAKQTEDPNKKKKPGYDDIIGSGGVINLKEYGKYIGRNASNELMQAIPGLNMLLGDGGIEGANLLATMLANPGRELSKAAVNKALGKGFDQAAKALNKTLENLVPSLIAKANAAAKKEDAGLAGLLGKILGIKTGSNESVDPNKYVKGAIPFDGITKKAIVDVIPYYLRKMTSAMTGGEEMTFDYTTGRWTSMKSAKKAYDSVTTSAQRGTESLIKGTIQAGTGRSFESMYASKDEYDRANSAVQSLALKLQAAGDFGSLRESDLTSAEKTIYTSMKKIFQRSEHYRYERDANGKPTNKMRKGFSGPDVSAMDGQLLEILRSQNSAIKQLNEQGGIAMLAAMEGITGDAKSYHGKSYVDAKGDMNERHIQEMPTAQVLLRAKDEYGVTLYQYLRSIGSSLNTIRAYSSYLRNLPILNTNNGGSNPPDAPDFDAILNANNTLVNYKGGTDEKYTSRYYEQLERKAKDKARESFESNIKRVEEQARKKGRSVSFITDSYNYQSEGDQIGMSRLVSDYYGEGGEYETEFKLNQQKEDAKKEKEKWKKMEELVGKETTDKLKKATDKYDKDKGLMENLSKATGTTEKLAIAAKWFTQKTNFAVMDKVTGTIVKTDAWLRNLIYGEDLKADDQKKSLWQLMKEHTQKFFDDVKEKLDTAWNKFKDTKLYKKLFGDDGVVTKAKKKIFGDVDSEGNILEEGVLSHFTAGFRKGMTKNRDDVHAMWKNEIEEAKRLAGKITNPESSSSNPSPSPAPSLTPAQRRALRRAEIESKLNSDAASDNSIISNNALETISNIVGYNSKRNLVENSGIYDGPVRTDIMAQEGKARAIAEAEKKVINLQNALDGHKRRLARMQSEGAQQSVITQQQNLIHRTEENLNKAKKRLESIKSSVSKVRGMAAGGVNRTGRPFQSVLSAGEYLNGSKIGQTGIYTIPKGGVVYNPAPTSVRNLQARNEKNFIRGLRYNAEANDGLTPEELAQHQQLDAESKKRIEQVDINKLTDWTTLEDDKQRAAFLGNMASRGALGGVAGLLVGGPLLGAAVGAASTLTKSTGSFASFLFGDVEKDKKTGEIIVDSNGNPKRKDTGLISKELQKAAPDMAKGGMAGMAAGLLTPLGPLGGLLIGTGLGFAKNSEIFQGSLFGEGGIFSDKNVDKLKKGAKNMGIGAATAALFLPGPFGLVGSALIGATAGYVTSTDKFKDFLLGEEDENGKRRGGVRGALNDNIVKPLKGFGQTIIDKTMDEIFGKKGDDDKREGGLFGAIRDNVITPMTSGAQSIFKELTNTIVDIKDFTLDIFKKIRANAAGNDFLGGVFEKAGKIGSGAIGIAGRLGRAATKPFRLLGDEGIGGRLKAKRIRKGRADDMTARQRLAARGKLKMAKTDQWSAIDEYLADGTSGDIESLLNILSYDENGGKIDEFVNSSYDVLGQELRNNLDHKDVKKVIKMLKEGRDKDVERFLNTRNIDDSTKKSVMKELKLHRDKMNKASKDYKDIESSKMTVQQYLLSKGINVDLSDKKAVRNLKLMANRELAHKGVGLTDEEVAFEAEKAFWKGKDSPLETVNTAAKKMEEMLENIHYDLTIGNGYDKLSKEEQAKYGSKEAYIKSVKDSRAQKAIKENAANGGYVIGKNNKIGSINKDSVKAGDFISNDLWNDYVPMLTGDLKGYLAADTRMANVLNNEINELIDTACQMFDGLALKELCVPERIRDDIQTYKQKIMNKEKCSEEEAVKKIKTMRRKITISRGEAVYTFEMSYTVNDSTVNPNKRQPNSYDAAKRQFIEDYLADHRPKTIEDSYMSFGDMISKSLKLGVYMNPINMPALPAFTGIHSLFVKDAIKTHGKSIISGAIKGVKKIGFNVGLALGDHKIDDNSLIQRLNNYQYQQEAEKEWNKEVASYQSALEALRTANTASEEVQNKLKEELADKFEFLDAIAKRCNLGVSRFSACSKDEQKQVHDEFVNMYIQAKKENQVFGRGIIGGIKQIGKRIVRSKLGQTIKLIKGTGKILFNDNAEGTKEERMKKVRENLKRKAEYAWSKLFIIDPNDKNAKPEAGPELQQLVKELYAGKNDHENDVAWKDLTEKEQEAIHTIFVERFINGRYQKLMNSLSDNIRNGVQSKLQGVRNKINNGIRTRAAKVADWANDTKEKIKKKASDAKRDKVISLAIKNKDERLDELALELYDKKYNELDAKEQNKVNGRFYARYGYGKASLTETFMRGAIKKVVGSDRYKSVTGTLKSGIRNATAGKLDAVRAWKEKNQEQDTLIGKFFDRMDARQLRKDKENFEGKKDSKIGKIIKWLFIGGIFVPLVVGFLKEDVLPAIREKVKPWLAKAKDKIFGVKNETTGEYEGGIISGIVNPIRKFFKSKFEKVHNWIHNEGEYNTDDKGLKGFWNGLAKVGAHIVDLWKVGFTTVYGDFVPKVLYAVGHNLIPMVGTIIKNVGLGLIDSIKDIATGRQGILDISIPSAEGVDVKTEASTVEVPNTVGGKVQLTSPAYSSKINFPSEVTNKDGSKITASSNEDGTVNYTNESTGKQVTSKADGDYYSIGTNANGQPLFKDKKTNKTYTIGSNGDYIPLGEYNELMDESLSENEAYQYQQQLENANALEADYTGRSAGSKVAGVAGRIAMRTGNMGLLNGAKGIRAMTGATKILGAPFKVLKKIPFAPTKIAGSLGEGITNLAGKVTKPITAMHSVAMNNIGKLGDKVTGGMFSRIGQKVVDKETANAAKIATKRLDSIFKTEQKIIKNSDKLAAVTAESADGIIPKTIQFLKKSVLKIKDKILKVLQDKKVAKFLGKNAAKNADEIAENTSKGLIKTLENSTDEITKKAGTVAAKGAAKVLSIVMMVADFLIGMDNCRNILGIVTPKPSVTERLTGGIINIIPDVIMTLAEVVTGASFGAAAAVGAILAGLSIIATIVISLDSIRDALVGLVIDVLDKIPEIDMSKIKEERAQAKAAVEAYNTKNNTNLSIEEYNNLIGNKTVTSKIGDGAKNAWSAMFGYDSASKNVILEKTANLESKGKSDKVRKKLSIIFSSIWQHFGEKDFNYSDQYDEDGNELKGKAKLNANKFKFNEVGTQVVSNLNAILVAEDESVIKEVASNVTNFTGPWDASHHLKDVYNSGKDDPNSQFDVDEEHSNWKRIRAMAGVCAIINEIFEPCGKKAEITKAVLDAMMPAYFTTDEMSKVQIEGVDTSKYSVDMSKYDEKAVNDAATSYDGIDKYGVATNANANDKLSPLTGNLDPLMKGLEKGFGWLKDTNPLEKVGIYFGNLINNSIKSLTGGFEGIEEFFRGLSSKNSSVNRGIDELSILPTDKNYWKIELDKKNPFMSGLFNFVESMNRVVKAPFALAAASLTAGMSAVQQSGSTTNNSTTTIINNSSSGSTSSSTGGTTSTTTTTSDGLWQGIKNTASKLWNGFKGLFGKGRDDSGYGADPYHIYQRAYSGSYRTAGDSESQTIADSGCGPASAASVLRMYGKKGDMRNAVNYALSNKYKEVNGGTYPEYFNSYLNKNGIKTNSNANNADVVNSLAQGKPVILMGRDSQNSGRTPYGSKYSHYVVARGLDKNGNVIVEDSEDKRGSTRYSLADTLQNSTVRITTGRGYGRANESLANRYVSGVSGVTAASIGNIVANTASALSGIKVVNGTTTAATSTNNTTNVATASTNGVAGSITPDTDVKTKCGYTADQLKAAISSIHPGCSAEQFPEAAIAVENSLGVNALFTCAVAIIEHGWDGNVGVNTTGANWGNWNVFNIEGSPNSSNGRWKDYDSLTDSFEGFGKLIMGSGYYGNGLTTPAKIGPRYCDSNWASGVCGVADTIVKHIGGSGRGKGIFSTLTKKFLSNVKNTIAYTATNNVLKLLNGSNISSNVATNTGNTSMVSGNASAALGKSLTMSDGKGNTHTIKITEDEVELYSMLTSECGLSPAAACGAIGNWEQECGINRIKEIATRGVIAYGGGIMQWTPGSKHTSWAESNGFGSNPWSWEANLAHAKEEIMTSGNWNNPKNASPSFESEGLTPVSSFNEFKVLTDPESAAANFERVYEVSGDWNGKNSEGVHYSENMIHDNLRRLNAKILYELIVNGKSGTNDDSSGSGRGTDDDKLSVTGRARKQSGYGRYGRASDPINFANSGEIERQEKLAAAGQENLWTAGVPVDTTKTEDTAKITNGVTSIDKLDSSKKNTTADTTTNNTTNASGLIPTMQKYTGGLLQGIFGHFYDALYGAESDGSTITTAASNNGTTATAAYNGNDVIYAAAMVFEALYNADQSLKYDSSGSTTHTLTCRDGTIIEHVRPDCSGMMTAVLQYMGYYTYRSGGKEYSKTYHGEGLNVGGLADLKNIYNENGDPTTDWEVIDASGAVGDNAKPGDIRLQLGRHTDMFVFYGSGNYPRGFNGGSGDTGGSIGNGMYNSYCLAKYYFEHNNQLPDPSTVSGGRGQNGAGTITDGEANKVLRFKGRSATGRGRGKADFSRLNRLHRPKNYVMTDIGRMYNKFGKGKFGRAEEDNTTVDETIFIGPQLPADKITPENTPGVSESDVAAMTTNNDKLSATTNTSSTNGKEPKAKSLISLLKKYIGLSTNSVTGEDTTGNTVSAANAMGAMSGGGTKENPAKGIDISYCDSENIDWDTLAKNISFVIIRIGSSYSSKTDAKTMTDNLFEKHYKNATEHGLAVGGYFYSYAKDAEAASLEADKCLEIIKGKTFQLPIYIDIEEHNSCLRPKIAGEVAQAFMDKMIAAGYATGIYCSAGSYTESNFNSKPGSGVLDNSKYSIWVANYTSKTNEAYGVTDYDIWQYSSTITPPGKGRNTDMDYCISSFADMANKRGGGTGRGKALVDKIMKSGKGKWGRAEEDDTTVQDENNSNVSESDVTTTENTTTTETTPTTTATSTTTSGQKPAATLISKLSKYAKAVTKGIFGNFYDALYGAEDEQQQVVANDGTVGVSGGTSGTLQTAIPYSTYAIWKQGWASRDGEPHWINKGWNTKTAISIGGADIGSSGCSLCSTALMLVHSGVVQEAGFDPGVFADDINSRTECRDICGGDSAMRHMCEYKGLNTMQYVDSYSWSYDGKSFDDLYNFVLESMQQGYFLIGHVTNHFCCIDYIDTAHKVIFIMDPGFRANCWYDGNNKPDCLDSTDIGYTMSTGPCSKKILGVIRYKSSVSNSSCYILNGRRSFDSLHENGDAPNASIVSNSTSSVAATTSNDTTAFAAANTSEDGTGRGKYGRAKNYGKEGPESRPGIVGDYDGTHAHRAKIKTGRGNETSTGVLKSYDSISRNHTNSGRGNVYNNSNSPSVHVSNTGRGSIMGAIDSTYAQYGGDNLASILRLAAIIADNSNKIDDILTVLATIAVNTENTTTAIGNSNNKKIPNGSKNGLSALRTALNDNNSGEDIINAIYQIAKS